MQQRGFSLVELMVALAVSLVLMSGVLSIFFSSKVTYLSNEKTARLQESGRTALDLIVHDVRGAGYPGCVKPAPVVSPFMSSLNTPTSPLWNFGVPVQGYEYVSTGTWSPTINFGAETLDPEPLDGSDVLAVRAVSRDAPALVLQDTMASGTDTLTVPNVLGSAIAAGQIMMVTDCFATAVFQVTGYTAGSPNGELAHTNAAGVPGNVSGNLGFAFAADARVLPVQTIVYYVATGADGGPALFRKVGAADSEELIPGVQALQVAYGEDTDSNRVVDRYVAADSITDWMDVISVSLSLLIRSEESGTEVDEATYSLLTVAAGGETVGPFDDRRYRMLFTTSAAIRNRAL